MAFLISDVKTQTPRVGNVYLFDANIWLAVLDPTFNVPFHKNCVSFFNKIINGTVRDAKIAMPALLLSEILNRLIKNVYFADFLKLNPAVLDKEYKLKYRQTPQYQADFSLACASIRAYHQYLKFVPDELDRYTAKELTKNIPFTLDFNDFIFAKIAKAQNLIIVTNDSDFQLEDQILYTSHHKLLGLI